MWGKEKAYNCEVGPHNLSIKKQPTSIGKKSVVTFVPLVSEGEQKGVVKKMTFVQIIRTLK